MRDLPGGGDLPNAMWNVWYRHLALSVCMTILVTALQVTIHPIVVTNEWLQLLLPKGSGLNGIYARTDFLRDRWSIDDLQSCCGVAFNRLFMVEKSSFRSREHFPVSGRPWEISLRWDNGCKTRPYKLWCRTGANTSFSLTFSETDLGRHSIKLEPNDPDSCGLYFGDQEAVEEVGECTSFCRDVIHDGPHTLTLKGENNSIAAFVDGSLCALATSSRPLEELMVELSTIVNSCVAFDSLAVRFDESESGWVTQFEEHFEASPFQSDCLDSGFDLDSKGSRLAITWVCLAAALLLDLAALALFGRRSPEQTILAVAVPQALAILTFQNIFLLPIIPIFCCVGAVWTSKALLSFRRRPQELQWVYYRPAGCAWALAAIAIIPAGFQVIWSKFGSAGSLAVLASASFAAMFMLMAGQWSGQERKARLVFWLILCELQALHWLWFRKIWIFLGDETIALVSLIPAFLILGLYASAITRPGWMRISAKLLAIALVIACIEFTLRSSPIQYLLNFEWRTQTSFWDLRRYTNLIVDHSKEKFIRTPVGAHYSTEKPDGVYRILCLGSSSTEGHVGEAENYPSHLGLLLDRCSPGSFEVINAGAGGFRLTQLRIYFEHILSKLDPDLLLFYFGGNADNPSDQEYYERVEALFRANRNIIYPSEVEAALSLRWPHPALIKSYCFLAGTRLFMGMKLLIDSLHTVSEEGMETAASNDFHMISTELLVKAALKNGTEILLIPEIIVPEITHPYESIFEKLTLKYAGSPVHMIRIQEFDESSYMADPQHMTAEGYGELARIISDYMIGAGLIQCDVDWPAPVRKDSSGKN